jgi:spoIIIJ-associated protein
MNFQVFVQQLLERMGFRDFHVEVKEEGRGTVFIYENQALVKETLPLLVASINHVVQLVAKKQGAPAAVFDVNNYRQERENLIAELAKAAAKKVHITKAEVALPAMNSYERRIVHTALAVHPEVMTESIGEGKERYVVVKPVAVK